MTQRTSLYDGLDVGLLQTRLQQMQLALLDLDTGTKVEVASYAQGDGNRMVKYTVADRGALASAIVAVQTQIDQLNGVVINRRKPLRFYNG